MTSGRNFQLSRAASSPSLTTFASGQSWAALGPAPINVSGSLPYTGRINSIALHPTDPQTLYIGTATGGVWKTTNGGTSWVPLTDDQCLAMGSVAVDPKNPQIVYAGTGEENFSGDSYTGCGVLVSNDGGSTWTQTGASIWVTSNVTAAISKVLIDTATAGSTSSTVVFAASYAGLYRSTNSGATWTLVLSGVTTDIVASPNANEYYAANYGGGIFKSVDKGATWTQLTGFSTTNTGRISLAISAGTPVVVYASAANNSTSALLGVWKSTDGGATWPAVTATSATCAAQCWYDMYLAVRPNNSSTVFFGGFNVYQSTDGASTFMSITGGSTNSVHVDQHALVFDPARPDTMYIGNDGGIYETTDGGITWSTLNTNLAITQFYAGISFNPANPTDILGGAQDNGTSEWTGSSAWTLFQTGDGAYTAFDHLGTTAYASFTSGSFTHGVIRRDGSSGPGGTFLNSGINSNDRSEWDIPFIMDPVNPSVLYYGTYRLYRSANRGTNWALTSPTADLTNGSGGISTIAVAPADTNTIYTGSGDGAVHVSTNLGASWTSISAGLPSRAITRVVVDPLDPHSAWVTVSGYGTGHVWKTVNAGATWTDISGNLPNAPVNALVYQPGSRELDVGTDIGVFSMPFGGSTWTPLAAALPNVPVIDLVYDGPNGRLIAGTHGRGMFSLVTTSAVLRGNITNSGTLSALDAQQILSAVVGLPIPGGSIRFPNGDANCDGNVTALDALLVLTKLVGNPTGGACVGNIH